MVAWLLKTLCGSLRFSHKGSKELNGTPESSRAGQLVGGGSSADSAFSLANQCFTLPSRHNHNPGQNPKWWPIKTSKKKGTMGRHTHTHIFAPTLVKKFGFSAGKAPLTVHQSEGDTGEVRARQIQGIIGPLSSLQLSLTRLVGENEGDRREFMTYPCNHRGALSQLDIKHMGRWKKYEKRKEKLRKVGKSVELSALSPNIWL